MGFGAFRLRVSGLDAVVGSVSMLKDSGASGVGDLEAIHLSEFKLRRGFFVRCTTFTEDSNGMQASSNLLQRPLNEAALELGKRQEMAST